MYTQVPLATGPSGIHSDLLGPSKGQGCRCNLMGGHLFRREAQGPATQCWEGLPPGASAASEGSGQGLCWTGMGAKRALGPHTSLLWTPPLSQGLSRDLSLLHQEEDCDLRLQGGLNDLRVPLAPVPTTPSFLPEHSWRTRVLVKVGEGIQHGGMSSPHSRRRHFFLNKGGILKVQSLTNIWIVYFTCQSAVTYLVLSGSHVN